MALRAAARSLVARRATTSVARSQVIVAARSLHMERRAFMSTSCEIFSAPSFPVKSAYGFEGTDPAVWMEKYDKADPSDMWLVGAFPVSDSMLPMNKIPEEPLVATSLAEDELWDTSGMLSALTDIVPMRDGSAHGVDEMLQEMNRVYGYYADSVLKKRRKKMNKHKHRKRKKAQRMRTKKN